MAPDRTRIWQAIKLSGSKVVHGRCKRNPVIVAGTTAACHDYGKRKYYEVVKEGPDAKELITCKLCRKALGLPLLPGPTVKGVKKLRGTCGVCGGNFRVKFATAPMSAHGFRISDGMSNWIGYRDGACPGQNHLPIEVNPITIQILHDALELSLVNRNAILKTLEARPETLTIEYKCFRSNWRGETKTFTMRATGEDDGRTINNQYMTYDSQLKQKTERCEWEIGTITHDLTNAKYRLKKWAPSDLMVEVVR